MYNSYNFPGNRENCTTTRYAMKSQHARFNVLSIDNNCHSLFLNSFTGKYLDLLPLLKKIAIWANRKETSYTNFYLTTNNEDSYYLAGLKRLIKNCKFKKCGRSFTNKRTKNKISMYTVNISTLLKTIKELECSQ